MADTYNLKVPLEPQNPVAQPALVDQKDKRNADKLEAQPQQHEYLIFPEKNLDKREQLKLQSQIQSAIRGEEPYSYVGYEQEKILYWVVNVTPDAAETIKKLAKVCFALSVENLVDMT